MCGLFQHIKRPGKEQKTKTPRTFQVYVTVAEFGLLSSVNTFSALLVDLSETICHKLFS